jgi:hypothetical protein
MRGEGRVFQRRGSSKWWISYYAPRDGRYVEHRESGGEKESEARKLLKERLREVAVHKSGLRAFQGPRQERVTVEELLKDLEADYEMKGRKSLPQLRSHMKHVKAHFGLDRALAVTTDRVTRFILDRQRAGAAPATINREVEVLQSAFGLASKAQPPKVTYLPKFPSLPRTTRARVSLREASSKRSCASSRIRTSRTTASGSIAPGCVPRKRAR